MKLDQDESAIKSFALKYASKYWTLLFAIALAITSIAVLVFLWALSPNIEPSPPIKEAPEVSDVSQDEFEAQLTKKSLELKELNTPDEGSSPEPKAEPQSATPSAPQENQGTSSLRELDPKLKESVQCVKDHLGDRWANFVSSPIHIKILDFYTENVDKLSIYKGRGRGGERVAQWSGRRDEDHLVVRDTMELTFTFQSDGSVTKNGWELLVYPEGADTSSPTPMNIDNQKRENGRIVSKPLKGAIRLYDTGGRYGSYSDHENIDLPILFVGASGEDRSFIDKHTLSANTEGQLRELTALCTFTKGSHIKDPSFTAKLIETLKLTVNREKRKVIYELFEEIAKRTSALQNAENVQTILSTLLHRTISKALDESEDLKLSETLLKIFDPFTDEIMTAYGSVWERVLLIANAKTLFKTLSQFDSFVDQVTFPDNINKMIAFIELLQLNEKERERAEERSLEEFRRAESEYEDDLSAYRRSRSSKSEMLMSSGSSVMLGLIIMGIFALALVIISIERATTKLLVVAHELLPLSSEVNALLPRPSAQGEPIADEPVADEPVADEPVAVEPVADAPVAGSAIDWAALSIQAFIRERSQMSLCLLKAQNHAELQLITRGAQYALRLHPEDETDLALLQRVSLFKVNELPVVLYHAELKLIAFGYGEHNQANLQFTSGSSSSRHTTELSNDMPGWMIYRVL